MRRLIFLALFLAGCGGPSAATEPSGEAAHSGEERSAPAVSSVECAPAGCSGQVCAEVGAEVMTTCEFRPEYACYRAAVCERQASGECGWTVTPELLACLEDPAAL
jgi:eight-cysteine-cluster-containing protein